jgi:predicted DNA-binding ribbon-helix-helix protein
MTGLPAAGPVKRSLTLSGHRTSVTLEPEFWEAFRSLAEAGGDSINALASRIDAERDPEVSLSSAIRVHVLRAALKRDPKSGNRFSD